MASDIHSRAAHVEDDMTDLLVCITQKRKLIYRRVIVLQSDSFYSSSTISSTMLSLESSHLCHRFGHRFGHVNWERNGMIGDVFAP
jgi:hypothetical protein